MRRHRGTRALGVLAVALLTAPLTAAATTEQLAHPASAGYAWSTEDPLVFVTAVVKLPTLDCGSPARLLTFPSAAAAEPRLGLWVGLRTTASRTATSESTGVGLRAGMLASCSNGRPYYALAYQEIEAGDETLGGAGGQLTTLAQQPALQPGQRVSVVLSYRQTDGVNEYAASWRPISDEAAGFWSRRAELPATLEASPSAARTTECVVNLLDAADLQSTRSMAGTVHVDRCSVMTFADRAFGISDISGGSQTTLPLDGSPSSQHDLTVQRYVVGAADTRARRWTATPRLLPPDGTGPAEGGRAFEVDYRIVR